MSYEIDQEILPDPFLKSFVPKRPEPEPEIHEKPHQRSDEDSNRDNAEDEDEILGSDDDEQESPKDYCKVKKSDNFVIFLPHTIYLFFAINKIQV